MRQQVLGGANFSKLPPSQGGGVTVAAGHKDEATDILLHSKELCVHNNPQTWQQFMKEMPAYGSKKTFAKCLPGIKVNLFTFLKHIPYF